MNGPAPFLAMNAPGNRVRVIPGDAPLDAPGWWPTWQPGHQALAVTRLIADDPSPHAALHLCGLDGGDIEVPGSMSTPPALIAEHIAHYAVWNRQGTALCYVMPAGRTLAARVWRTGDAESTTLTGGTPIFVAWLPSGDRLALHHGSTLELFDVASDSRQRISNAATGFRVPAISPDGQWLAFAEAAGGGTIVSVFRPTSGELRAIGQFDGGVAMAFRPGTNVLTVGVTPVDEANAFHHVFAIDLDSPEPARQLLMRGPIVAFWWAPGGERLAVLHPGSTGDGRVQLRFHSASGAFERAMEAISLSPDIRTLVAFFDQFVLSHALWSPDGSEFALAGRLLGDGLVASFADSPLDAVLVAGADAAGPWRRAGTGTAGFFQPSEVNGR